MTPQNHKSSLALWAANCAERVLHYFEDNRSQDSRPRRAIEATRSWARGELLFRKVREAALAAHAAARTTDDVVARMAARSAGQAAGTAHAAGHACHAAAYALKAINAADGVAAKERNWQRRRLKSFDLGADDVLLKKSKALAR